MGIRRFVLITLTFVFIPTEPPPRPRKRKLDYDASEYNRVNISPSEFSKPSKFRTLDELEITHRLYTYNRPIDFESVPLTLISPIFGRLSDDLFTDHEGLRWQDFAPARDLANKMSILDKNEVARIRRFKEWLLELLPDVKTDESSHGLQARLTSVITKGGPRSKSDYKTDGHVELGDYLLLAVEGKRELGELPSNPHWQLMAYFRAYYMQERCSHHVGRSSLPAILIAIYGMFIPLTSILTC